jgi:hypoxanthine phosphoribosyltransferase
MGDLHTILKGLAIFLVILTVLFVMMLVCLSSKVNNFYKKSLFYKTPDWFDSDLNNLLMAKLKRDKPTLNVCMQAVGGWTRKLFDSECPYLMSWDTVEKSIGETVSHMTYQPDYIIGVKSGGAFIGKKVQLECTKKSGKTPTLRYVRVGGDYSNRQITEPLSNPRELKGKVVLVVDDQCTGGGTLRKMKAYCHSLGARDVKTLVIKNVFNSTEVDFNHKTYSFGLCWPWGCDA